MSYYGGTITVDGRNLITSLMAGKTIEFTRIVVGSGKMPEGVEPIDMKELVQPVAEAVSTIPVVDNGVMSMIVEYRNDLNGGLETGFWLEEFGIFAKTEDTEEVLLYYATLGDSPQPVNAYKDNRVDIRRYPISIALELDADIQIEYTAGAFITAAEADTLLRQMVGQAMGDLGSAIITDITIPAEGWTWQEDDEEYMDEFSMFCDAICEEAKAEHFPSVALDKTSLETAKEAGLCPTIQALDGKLRFWARNHASEDMTGTVALISPGTSGGEGGGTYILPVASATTLGGVKIQANSGLQIDGQGNLSINDATRQETEEMYDGEERA